METPPPPGFEAAGGNLGNCGRPRSGYLEVGDDPSAMETVEGMIEDLPEDIRQRIDLLVQNDEELGSQLAAIDALVLGKCTVNICFMRHLF